MIRKFFLIFSLIITITSCSFKAASGTATQELVARGAFPGDAPVWVKHGNIQGPEGYSGANERNFGNNSYQNILNRRAAVQEIEKKKLASQPKEERSDLNKILDVCPRIEQELAKVITIADLAQRIEKYEYLTKRCAISPELWVWLGNDYLSSGDYARAKLCASRAISLDSRDENALTLLRKAGNRK